MLFDTHTHAGVSLSNFFDDKYPYCNSVIGIAQVLAQQHFDAAVVFPFHAYVCGDNIELPEKQKLYLRNIFESVPYKNAVGKLLTEVERFKMRRLLPFGMFSINYAVEEQIEYLNQIVSQIYGLKYYPDADAQTIDLLISRGRSFLDYLIRNDLPLVVHVSENACLFNRGYSNVEDVVQLAMEIPELRISAAHMGHFSKKALQRAAQLQLPNLYFDLSPFLHLCHIRTMNGGDVLNFNYHNPIQVMKGVYDMFPNNLLWGSDMPFNFTCNLSNLKHSFEYENFSIENNYSLLEEIDPIVKAQICSINPLNFLFGNRQTEAQDAN